MYDTSPFSPFKGEIKTLFSSESDTKALETLFDLHPSLEKSFDLTEFVASSVTDNIGATLPGVPDSAAAASPVTSSSGDLLTLSSAATSQHLAEIERLSGTPVTATSSITTDNSLQTSGLVVPTVLSPVQLHQAATTPPPVTCQQPALSPALTVDEVSQAFSDDSCIFMPEYEQLTASTVASSTTQGGEWGAQTTPFYSTVKTEDLGLGSLRACNLEASLPVFNSSSNTVLCKAEPFVDEEVLSPPRSARTLSESSSATTSTIPDSPRRSSKGGSKRRQVPKGTEEYKEKRARNNIAVRKSRAKAKEKQRMTESRVKELMDLNDSLQKKVEMLTKELTVLKGLFINVGASLPDDFTKLMEQS